MSKVLIDTNILVYGIDQDSRFFHQARNILDGSDHQLVTTSKNLLEFLAVVTRSSGYDLKTELALEIHDDIIRGIDVLYPSQDSLAIFLELMNRYQPSGLKVHDFEIISIGLAAGIHQVATFNEKDFKNVQEISLLEI
ncbi:type II toxin-antitoxin system VapC family toxin [Halalkalibaculum sp. DA3122]|uniref:type II toxin-antitoxin system VapC family toxin n=1 Tax=unclassified Halalkalibaculum TaxID=2964617 RepID=UPI003754341A